MDPQDRRSFLRRTVGVAGALGVLGGGVAGAARPTNDSIDAEVTVTVGPGGNLVFEPGMTRISPGTTVRFVWESDNHNVVVDDQPSGADWNGTPGERDVVYDAGHEYTHTFETPGRHEFHCEPHQAAGMEGVVEVFDPDVTVTVGPGGNLVFEPADLTIERGTEVIWTWGSDNHNIVVDSQPDGAEWAGTPGGDERFYDEGYEYRHTFEVVGTYEYHCVPHQSAGMIGSVEVVEAGATSTPTTAGEPTTAGGATDAADEETDAADESDGGDGESIPFSGPAVVGTGALTAGALARLRRQLADDGE